MRIDKSMFSLATCLLLLQSPGFLYSQSAGRMSEVQYAKFLDEVEGTLPTLDVRIASLCGSQPSRSLDPTVQAYVIEALDSCRETVPMLIKTLTDDVAAERRSPRLATEYIMEFDMRGIIEAASDVSELPIRDPAKLEEATTINEKLQPLDLEMHSHLVAILRSLEVPPFK